MATGEDPLALARRCHAEGQLVEAEQLCRQVLQTQPLHPGALYLLGVTCQAQGRLAEAISWLQQATRCKPDLVRAYNDLGIALSMAGRWEEAGASFQQAVRLKPDYAEAHNNLGSVFRELGKRNEALASFQQAVRFAPHFSVGYNNQGVALLQAARLEEALESFQHATRLAPDFAEAHQNAGIVCNRLGRLALASESFQNALALGPAAVESLVGLASVLYQQGIFEEAIATSRRALELKPDHAEAHNNLGQMLLETGQTDAALAEYERALLLKPEYPDAHWNRGLLLLLMGRFQAGWLEYEWRRVLKRMSFEALRRPLWDGSPLNGRSILLHSEQGAGDIFQAIRFAPVVKMLGGAVVVSCPGRLLPILSRCPGIDRLVARESPLPAFDVHAPLMSVPGILATTIETIPAAVPYVFAEPKLVESWRAELGAAPGLKVGIAWQGDPKFPGDRYRSIPLGSFAPLAKLEGVGFYSLQKGLGSEQLAGVAGQMDVTDLGPRLDESSGAFMDTAAVMKNLDLVVTSDTSIAHLAGALGVRVWLAVTLMPDWRWLLGREDSPWYPTMRVFRQTRKGDWDGVFERIAGALRHLGPRAAEPPATT
jgi:tetratricopeptide (TPR) repeat protein